MTREELLEQAKVLAENPDAEGAFFQAKQLRKKWGKVREEEESLYDKEMTDKFNEYLSKVTAKEGEVFGSIEERKKNIIDRAKELLNQTNIKKATDAMNNLMEEWKASGRMNKEKDDELWAEFKQVKDDFFDKRSDYYKQLFERYDQNKEIKKGLIEKAKEANKLENIKEASNIMDQLMEQWKKTGKAGREDDELWKEFAQERSTHRQNRNAYYSSLKEMFANRVVQKQEIIEKAKRNLAVSNYTDEEFEQMKDLRRQWKEVGSAGKENENALWEQFNEIMTIYFENAKYYRN